MFLKCQEWSNKWTTEYFFHPFAFMAKIHWRGTYTHQSDRLFCYSCHCHWPFRYISCRRAEAPGCCTHACDFWLLRHTLPNMSPTETKVPNRRQLKGHIVKSLTLSFLIPGTFVNCFCSMWTPSGQKIPEADRESGTLMVREETYCVDLSWHFLTKQQEVRPKHRKCCLGESARLREAWMPVIELQLWWRCCRWVQVGLTHWDRGQHGRPGFPCRCPRSPCPPAEARERCSAVSWWSAPRHRSQSRRTTATTNSSLRPDELGFEKTSSSSRAHRACVADILCISTHIVTDFYVHNTTEASLLHRHTSWLMNSYGFMLSMPNNPLVIGLVEPLPDMYCEIVTAEIV